MQKKKYKELQRMLLEAKEIFNIASEAANKTKTVFDK
jgi:hypothetical protein